MNEEVTNKPSRYSLLRDMNHDMLISEQIKWMRDVLMRSCEKVEHGGRGRKCGCYELADPFASK